MATTRIKDFVIPILDKIKKLPPEKDCSDLFVYVESQVSFDKLVCFLEENAASDESVFITTLKPFCDFLSERWFRIKNTDAIYPHHPNTIANRACCILAEKLAEQLGLKLYDLLMPTVSAIIHQTSRANLNSFKFHEFILGDDGTPIEVAKCLSNAVQDHTVILFYTGLRRQALSAGEKSRIINHSIWANRYYKSIEKYVKYGAEDHLEIGKKLNEAISQDNYKVCSSYGQEGRIKLAQQILTSMKTQQDFINVLIKFVPQLKWKEFISSMPTDELSSLILGNDSLMTAIGKKNAYQVSAFYNRALFFCFVEIYWRMRAKGDRFNSIFGQLADYTHGFLGGFTREQKEEAVKLLQDFLMSNQSLNKLKEYAVSHARRTDAWKAIFEMGSNLAYIADQINNVSDPEFFKEPKPGWLGFVNL